jgi:hypothetical protein
MNKRVVFLAWLNFILIVFLVLPAAGCDRLITINGTVYEWVDAPPGVQSKIYHKQITSESLIKDAVPEGLNLQPLSNIHVQCFGPIKADTFYSNQISDEGGHFRLLIALGRRTEDYTATLQAGADGFYTAKRDVVDSGNPHAVTIILVRNTPAEASEE